MVFIRLIQSLSIGDQVPKSATNQIQQTLNLHTRITLNNSFCRVADNRQPLTLCSLFLVKIGL
jgi:hypothetical protein